MRKTKLVALLLVVAIVASLVVPSVSAADPYEAYITDEAGNSTTTVEAGQYVALVVSLAGNPGISNLALKLQYPEGWEISYFENFKLFDAKASTLPTFSPDYTSNPYTLMWTMGYGTTPDRTDRVGKKLSFENGDLCLVEFLVPADAMSGDYEVSLTTAGFESQNYQMATDADGVITNGDPILVCPETSKKMTITVQGNEPAGTACPEHTDVTTWTEIAEGSWTGGALEAGHYKLTGNQATTSALTVAGNVCIDLNGYNITAGAKTGGSNASYRVFEIAATGVLTVSDSAETDGVISGGRIKATAEDLTVAGGCAGANIYNEGTFTLYGGVVADGVATSGSVSYNNYGGNIYGAAGSVINIHGGQVKDGALSKGTLCYGTAKSGAGYGGNIYTAGTLNITDGIISGGHYVGYNDPTVTKYDGTSRLANKVYGGNIALASGSVMNMSNGTITEGSLVVNLSTAATSKQTVYAFGGNIYAVSADINITGGTISNGRAEAGAYTTATRADDVKDDVASRGGNIYITSGTTMDIENATVIGGVAEQSHDTNAGYDKETGAQTTSYGTSQGGNIYISSGTVTIKNATISDGQSDYRGGNIAIGTGTLNIIDSKLLNGTLKNEFNRNIATGEIGELYELGTAPRGADIYASGDITINISGNTEFAGANGGDYTDGQSINTRGDTVVNIYNGDLSDKSSCFDDKSTATLYGGKLMNDPKQLGGKLSVGENKAAILEGTVYTPAEDLAAALTAAAAGSEIILLADAAAEAVTVPAGTTLNLNGNTLTADSVTAAFEGSNVIDSKGTGKVVSGSVSFDKDNKQLPIKTADGYVFETVKFAEKLVEGDNSAIYKFYVKSEAAKTLIDNAILAGESVAINVRVTWTNGVGDPKEKTFTLDTVLMAQLAENWDTKAVILTINDLTNVSDLACYAQVSVNGVTIEA